MGSMTSFTVENDSYLSCDIIQPYEGYDTIAYRCKFVKKLDILRAVATDPLPPLSQINVKQDKMKKSTSNFAITSEIFKDRPTLGGFTIDLKPGIECSTRGDGFGGKILDCA